MFAVEIEIVVIIIITINISLQSYEKIGLHLKNVEVKNS